MAADDELKSIARFLLLGLIAVIGAFSMGMAVFQNDISFQSRRLVFGGFLMSFSATAWYVPQIYSVLMSSAGRREGRLSYKALFWSMLFGAVTGLLGRVLYRMM